MQNQKKFTVEWCCFLVFFRKPRDIRNSALSPLAKAERFRWQKFYFRSCARLFLSLKQWKYEKIKNKGAFNWRGLKEACDRFFQLLSENVIPEFWLVKGQGLIASISSCLLPHLLHWSLTSSKHSQAMQMWYILIPTPLTKWLDSVIVQLWTTHWWSDPSKSHTVQTVT